MTPLAQRPREYDRGRAIPTILGRHTVRDILFLSLVVLLSLVLYVRRLGFYSDDWAFLMLLNSSPEQSISGLAKALYAGDVVIRQRPSQVLYLAGLYWLFGLEPLGYHLANGAVLLASGVLLYLVLCELEQPRPLALSVPLVYALLPHYSTDRFWVAAFQATLSMVLYLLSLYADLGALESRRLRWWVWRAVGVLSLIGSGLAYEVTLPLLLALNPLLLWHRAQQLSRSTTAARITRTRWLLLLAGNVAALTLVVAYKALVTVRVNVEMDFVSHVAGLVAGAVRVNYGTYGLGLPYLIWWILRHRPDLPTLAVAGVLGLVIFTYLWHVTRWSRSALPNKTTWLKLIGLGVVVFGLGYAVFLVNADVWFTSASLGNRIAIAAALGVALTLVGGLGWASGLLMGKQARGDLFCMLITLLCMSGFLVTNTLGLFWGEAYRRQQQIISDVRQVLPALPAGSAVILDGACLEHGGAYVFTGGRDVAGIMAIVYHDRSLRATSIDQDARVAESGVLISTYRRETIYPYGERLFLYNVEQKKVYRLINAAAARAYFRGSTFRPERDCPPGFAWGWNAAAGAARRLSGE
jgi:hypothetical protein